MSKYTYAIWIITILISLSSCKEEDDTDPKWEELKEIFEFVDLEWRDNISLWKPYYLKSTDTSIIFAHLDNRLIEIGESSFYHSGPFINDPNVEFLTSKANGPDSTLLFLGISSTYNSVCAKVDYNGSIIFINFYNWTRSWQYYTYLSRIFSINDGIMILVKNDTSSVYNYSLMRLNEHGDSICTNNILNTDEEFLIKNMHSLTDSSFYMVGEQNNIYLAEISYSGNIIWERDGIEEGFSYSDFTLISINDNYLIFSRNGESFFKTDLKGNLLETYFIQLGPYKVSSKLFKSINNEIILAGTLWEYTGGKYMFSTPVAYFVCKLKNDFTPYLKVLSPVSCRPPPFLNYAKEYIPNHFFVQMQNVHGSDGSFYVHKE